MCINHLILHKVFELMLCVGGAVHGGHEVRVYRFGFGCNACIYGVAFCFGFCRSLCLIGRRGRRGSAASSKSKYHANRKH